MLWGLLLSLLPYIANANYAIGDPAPMCWALDAKNTPVQCPPGLQADWAPGYGVPSTIYVGVPVVVRMSLNITIEAFEYLERLNLISKTSSMTAQQKWQQCAVANNPCPSGQQDADSCCLFHVNGHSCQNKPGLFCGPWVGNDGHLATHTPAQTGFCGADGRTHFDFLVKLFWEGSYTVIGHIKMGGFHFAIGTTTEVEYGTKACTDPFQVPSRSGPCESCPNGTQPLSQGMPPGSTKISDDMAIKLGLNPLCVACPPGWASPEGRICSQCPSGQFAGTSGSSVCTDCPAGRHAYEEGSSACRLCSAGSYAPAGSLQCLSCPRGRYRATSASLNANSTSASFAGDETDCTACPAPYSTIEQRSTNISDCVCPEGTYALPDQQHETLSAGCMTCTAGMRCEKPAMTAPLQAAGFQVVPVENGGLPGEYEAYRCLPKHCPAATAGVCSVGRTGKACGECMTWYLPVVKSGGCEPCQGQDLAPATIMLGVLGIMLCCLFIWAGADAAHQRLSTLGLLCIIGQVVVTVQIVTSISSMQFSLVDPLRSIVDTFSVMNLNVDGVKVQCVLGTDKPIVKYGLAIASYPIFALALVAVFSTLKCITRRVLSPFDIANSLGLMLMVLFLPVTVLCLQPFRCTKSPSGHSSVTTAASVFCGEGEHGLMVAIGTVGTLIYPVTVLGGVLVITYLYPRMVAMGKGAELLRCCRFLYQRFTPRHYYYSVVYLARSTCVALLPVAFPDPGYYLPFGLTVTVAVTAMLTAAMWPWRTPLANYNDLACGFFLIMVLAVTNALADLERSLLERQLSVLLTICTAVGLGTMFFLLTLTMVRVFRLMRYKKYSLFLTHHKQGAGCLARLIKLRLRTRIRPEIFLDSDNLDDLETLFDTVRCDTDHLLAILTEETLRRPWCAGEIVTAMKNKVPITIAAHSGLQLPSPADIQDICSIWSPEELHPLQACGVTEASIQESYQQLPNLPRAALPRTLASERETKVLDAALQLVVLELGAAPPSRTQTARSMSLVQLPKQLQVMATPSGESENVEAKAALSKQSSISESKRGADVARIIVSNMIDPEAGAAAFVLQHIMRTSSHDAPLVSYGHHCIATATGRSAVLIVILTKGCLESPNFMRTILTAQKKWGNQAAIVSVVADKSFCFPSKEDVGKILSFTMAESLQKKFGLDVSPDMLQRCYGSILHILALVFSSQLGMDILETETAMICRRVDKAVEQLHAKPNGQTPSTAPSSERAPEPQKQHWMKAIISSISTVTVHSPSEISRAAMSERACNVGVSVLGVEELGVEHEHNFKENWDRDSCDSPNRSSQQPCSSSSEAGAYKVSHQPYDMDLEDWEPGQMSI